MDKGVMPYSSTSRYLLVFSTKIYKVQIPTPPTKKKKHKGGINGGARILV